MNRILALLAIVLFTVSCGKKYNYTISGKIEGGAGKTVYLNRPKSHTNLTEIAQHEPV